jgi:hypothetical protein
MAVGRNQTVLKNLQRIEEPNRKALSVGFFNPLEKSLACGAAGARAGFVFLHRFN